MAASLRQRNRQIVADFYDLAFRQLRHEEAARRYFADRYVQHNPFVADGLEGFVSFFATFDECRRPGFEQRVLHLVADEDLVAVHATMTAPNGPGCVLVDIFHVDAAGKIDEHWDVFKELADPATIPHGNGETAGVVTGTRSDAATNRGHLEAFYQLAFVDKRYAEAADRYFGDRYVQHNSFVPDGVDGFKAHFSDPGHARPSYRQQALRFIVDDDFGVVHEWLRPNADDPADLGVMIVDLFRFDQGLIVEHWDVFTPRWSRADSAHGNDML